jgi:hypothetical protein
VVALPAFRQRHFPLVFQLGQHDTLALVNASLDSCVQSPLLELDEAFDIRRGELLITAGLGEKILVEDNARRLDIEDRPSARDADHTARIGDVADRIISAAAPLQESALCLDRSGRNCAQILLVR